MYIYNTTYAAVAVSFELVKSWPELSEERTEDTNFSVLTKSSVRKFLFLILTNQNFRMEDGGFGGCPLRLTLHRYNEGDSLGSFFVDIRGLV